MAKRPLTGFLICAAMLACGGLLSAEGDVAGPGPKALKTAPAFVENRGQWSDASVRYALVSGPMRLGLGKEGLRFLLRAPEGLAAEDQAGLARFWLRFEQARLVEPQGIERLEATRNYQVGPPERWRERVPAHAAVAYDGLYPGVRLLLRVVGSGRLQYGFEIEPGADWRQIRLRYEGIDGLSLREDGSLAIRPRPGWPLLSDAAPRAWQRRGDGQIIELPCRYTIKGHALGYALEAEPDPGLPLILAPMLHRPASQSRLHETPSLAAKE